MSYVKKLKSRRKTQLFNEARNKPQLGLSEKPLPLFVSFLLALLHKPKLWLGLMISGHKVFFSVWLLQRSQPNHKVYIYLSSLQVSGISREMLLLSNAVEMEDSCWEMRLRCG